MGRRRVLVIAAVAAWLCAVTAGAAAAAPQKRWSPPAHLTWYWQLQGRVRTENVAASDIDGFENGAPEVRRLHALGQHVICYVDVGSWERWRPDAARFPPAVLGRGNGWPGERWLDVRRLAVLEPIMRARFAMCARKGFDAVEPDNMDGFENPTGFRIRAPQQLAFDDWVARTVHGLGMAVFEKNDPEQARALEPHFDGVLDEQCNQYHECAAFRPYLRAGKPVLNAEYRRSLYPGFCANDRRLGISGALYALDLNGTLFEPCTVNSDSLRL
ncbi:MAG: endo alpha-1,4 polygalactosaminidase [Solirubrobacteraceae bacterium]